MIFRRLLQSAKNDVYAEQYLDFATKYFGHGMNAEARRCYAEAFRWQPSILTKPRVFRQLLASYIPGKWYDSGKKLMKRWRS